MKLVSLSEKLLKHMVTEYKSNGKELFGFQVFRDLYPALDDDFISKSLYLLEGEDFVSVFRADDVAYVTTINPMGIRSVEENTLLKKGFTIFKEIKSLID